MNFSFYMLMPTMPVYLVEVLGIDTASVGIALSSYTIGLLCVRPFSGFLVDCFSRKPLYLFAFFVFAFMFGGYLIATTMLTIMAVRFIQGGFMGLTSVAGNTIAIDVIPSSRRGEGMGFYGLTINLAMSLAPLVAVFFPRPFYPGEGVAGCACLYPGGYSLWNDYLFCCFVRKGNRGGRSGLFLYLYGDRSRNVAPDLRQIGRSWEDTLGVGLLFGLLAGDVYRVCDCPSVLGFLCLRLDDWHRVRSRGSGFPMPLCQCRSA